MQQLKDDLDTLLQSARFSGLKPLLDFTQGVKTLWVDFLECAQRSDLIPTINEFNPLEGWYISHSKQSSQVKRFDGSLSGDLLDGEFYNKDTQTALKIYIRAEGYSLRVVSPKALTAQATQVTGLLQTVTSLAAKQSRAQKIRQGVLWSTDQQSSNIQKTLTFFMGYDDGK